MNEPGTLRNTVWDEGSDSFVGQHIFLHLVFRLVENMSILLLTHQISLIKWIWWNFNRLDPLNTNSQFRKLLDFVRIICEQYESTFDV